MGDAKRDANYVTTMIAVSSADGITPVALWADPTTHRLLVDSAGGGITIGTTTIASGTDKGILYNNAGVVGEYTPGASLILATDASKNVVGLATTTYPSLTELSYVKGLTSSAQTQINTKMTNPMTTGGDLIYGGASGTPTRLANGSAGQVLQSNGTTLAPSWVAAGAGDMVLASAQTNSGIKTFLDTTMKLRNVGNTFDGYFVNTNTADRIYTLQDRAGTLADNTDLALKAPLATPVFTTNITTPLIIGGTAVGSNIIYKSTTGIGTDGGIAHQFVGGTDGATVAMTVLNNGNVGIGTTGPTAPLQISKTVSGETDMLRIADAAGTRGDWEFKMSANRGLYLQPNVTDGSSAFFSVLNQTGTSVLFVETDSGNVGIGTTDLDGTPAIGRLTIKGSTNDGSTNIFVGRDSDEANVFSINTNGQILSDSLTASEILGTDASKNIVSLAVATYPSLTELSYVKGLSSAVQTQINAKAPSASPTFTGTTIQSGNVDLDLPASDHTATGLTTNAILSGATVAAFELVFLGTGGKWLLVDADAVATCKGMMAIALEAKNDTQAMLVALPGSFVRDDTWNWTIGDTLYAGETPGTMQNTIPTGADAIIKVVGFAVSADVIFFNPSPDQQTTVA